LSGYNKNVEKGILKCSDTNRASTCSKILTRIVRRNFFESKSCGIQL